MSRMEIGRRLDGDVHEESGKQGSFSRRKSLELGMYAVVVARQHGRILILNDCSFAGFQFFWCNRSIPLACQTPIND